MVLVLLTDVLTVLRPSALFTHPRRVQFLWTGVCGLETLSKILLGALILSSSASDRLCLLCVALYMFLPHQCPRPGRLRESCWTDNTFSQCNEIWQLVVGQEKA